jgi:hypothetical protein
VLASCSKSSQPKSQDFIVPDGKSLSSDSDSGSWNCSQGLENSIHTSQASLCPDSHCLCRSESVFIYNLKRKPRGFDCNCRLRSDKPEPNVYYKVLDIVRCLGSSLRRLIQQRRVSQLHGSREQPVNARLVHPTNVWRGGLKQ